MDTVYQVVLVPNNALLSHEIFPAAVAAEQGADVQAISDMGRKRFFRGRSDGYPADVNGGVKTQLQGRGWTHWLEVPGIEYE